ncbi:MAG: DEAD/DEAH box helicase [Pseudobdellovibrionaceae bacterium]
MELNLSAQQSAALDHLESGENIFLTGGAGSGKSFLIRHFMTTLNTKTWPLLASTGAAAVLVGGRTFHSFFSLGIMEGGFDPTFNRALKDGKMHKRLREAEGLVIDEVSMIPGEALQVAEALARASRQSSLPWGGLRIIAVGDFAQLPPVTRTGQRDWCFLTETWRDSGFTKVELTHNQRVSENVFLDVLQDVRYGQVTERVKEFLNQHVKPHDEMDPATRLFPRKDQSEFFNQKKLQEISDKEHVIDSIYLGEARYVQSLAKSAPVGEKLVLKKNCRVMFLQNDPQQRWVNGTRGIVTGIEPDKIRVRKEYPHKQENNLPSFGREITVEKTQFSMQDSEGKVVASVIQFPLGLAYATTIHKSQGSTLDSLWCDLSRLWEPGHAYVALSRLTSAAGLNLISWSPRSIIVDPKVVQFYQSSQVRGSFYDEENRQSDWS